MVKFGPTRAGSAIQTTNNSTLTCSPPMFSPSENSTHTVGPSDNCSVVHLVLMTVGPSPNPTSRWTVRPTKKWTFVPQNLGPTVCPTKKINICTPKSWTNCHNVAVAFTRVLVNLNFDSWSKVLLLQFWPTQTVTLNPMFFQSMSPRLWTCCPCCRLPPWPLTIIPPPIQGHSWPPATAAKAKLWQLTLWILVHIILKRMPTKGCQAVDLPPLTLASFSTGRASSHVFIHKQFLGVRWGGGGVIIKY